MANSSIPKTQVEALHKKLNMAAESGGYHLNPDDEFTKDLTHGLLVNENRYGYPSCPCRLATGNKKDDLDIICPCDYRDADVVEYDTCYCGLYVSKDVVDGKREIGKIPERRVPKELRKSRVPSSTGSLQELSFPVWRCRVCGYLCAREQPPEVCPICKAKKDRFEKFIENI